MKDDYERAALREHAEHYYGERHDDHKLLHVLWVGPLLWLILWLAMALF